MKDKDILVRRLIYILMLVLSLVFISYRGGHLPYMLFWALVVNAICSLVYIVYVYVSIRMYQDVPNRRSTKLEYAPYSLKVSNESLVAYREVQITFFSSLAEVRGVDKHISIHLEPGESFVARGDLFCKYSGTYYGGVKSIQIMDYFGIFRIRFPMPEKLKLMINPRVQALKDLTYMAEESRSSSQMSNADLLPDGEVRKYQPWDNKKWIHWRNSAKRNELMVRNPAQEELSEYVIIMDACMNGADFETKIMLSDKFRESVLALAHSMYSSGYYVRVLLGTSFDREILTQRDFKALFESLVNYSFGETGGMEQMVDRLEQYYHEQVPFVFVTSGDSSLSQDFREQLQKGRRFWWINIDLLTIY